MIFNGIITLFAIIFVVVFQQDIKKFLEKIGNTSIKQYLKDLKGKFKGNGMALRMKDETISDIVDAVFSMGSTKTGSLIVIEKDTPLNEVATTGIDIDAKVSAPLLKNIFEKNTPLHDGAVIIKGDTIISATCYLPLTPSLDISKALGTRHRAGIGITESLDCFAIMSSEENGHISYAEKGTIHEDVTREELTDALKRIQMFSSADFPLKKRRKRIGVKNAVFAVFLGLVFWFVSMSIMDPVSTKTIDNVPIEPINEEAILSTNKVYDLGSDDTVSITVEDKSSILNSLTAADFTATLDLSRLSYINTAEVDVTPKNNTTKITKIKNKIIKINLDDISYGEFPIEAEANNSPPDGYSLKEITTTPGTLNITGASSLIKKIDKVVVPVNINSLKDNESVNSTPIVYDKNGDIISPDKIELSVESVSATVYFNRSKTVPINLTAHAEQGSIGKINSIEYEPKEITLIGSADTLNAIDKLDIDVPVKIEISDTSNNELTKVISLKDYIPDDLSVGTENEKVTITLKYTQYPSTTLNIPSSSVVIKNGIKGYSYNIEEKTIEVVVFGSNEAIKAITEKDLSLAINVGNIKETSEANVYIYTKQKVIIPPVKVTVNVKESTT